MDVAYYMKNLLSTVFPPFALAALCMACPIANADGGSGRVCGAAVGSALNSGFESLQKQLFSVFENNKDSVVKVYAQKEISEDSGAKRTILEAGTGFLISADGHVMTSAYVTYSAQKLWVEWRGVLFDAECSGYDPLTTVSLVKVSSGLFKKNKAPFVAIDPSAELPRTASLLAMLSYELGMPVSPRMGLALGRNIEFGGTFLPTVYIRTNIAAIQGSIGGPVFELSGKFAGMAVAAIPEAGGSFIIPAKAAAKIRDDIILCGEPVYSWFGLRTEDVDSPTGSKLVVSLVAENAPAKRSGFMEGDVILEINAKEVSNNTELRNFTFFVRPGETAVFKIRRGDKILKLHVPAERMSADIVRAAESKLLSRRPLPKAISEGPKDSSAPTNSKGDLGQKNG